MRQNLFYFPKVFLPILQGETFLAKTENPKIHWPERYEKLPALSTKTKPKTNLEKTLKLHKAPKPKTRSFKEQKAKSRTKNWQNSLNRKPQRPPH